MIKPHASASIFLISLALTGCRRSDFPSVPKGFWEFAYIANSGSNTVTVLDLVYLRVDRTLRVGERPTAIAFHPSLPEAYVLNTGSNSLSILNTENNSVAATLAVPHDPTALSVDPAGTAAYIASTAANSITALDLTTRKPLITIHTDHPTSALISPDGRTLLVTNPVAGTVTLFAATPVVRTQKTPFGPSQPATQADPLHLRATFANCPGATSPVILPDSSKAFIACPAADQVLALSLAAALNSWPAKQDSSLLEDHPLALLDVGQNPTNLTLKPDGGEVFVSNAGSGSISEISTQTNEVGSTFGIGDHPAHGVVSFDNSILWVASTGADAVSLYSIDDGRRLPSIHVGNAPDALAFTTEPPTKKGAQRFLLVTDRNSGDIAVIRTNSVEGPALLTMLPAGREPAAIAIRSNQPAKP